MYIFVDKINDSGIYCDFEITRYGKFIEETEEWLVFENYKDLEDYEGFIAIWGKHEIPIRK
jgi:hypothetical protein